PHGGQPFAGDSVALSVTPTDGNTCGTQPVTPFTYAWSLISAPPGSSAQLSSTTAASPVFIADVPNGTWQVALTVTDAIGLISAPSFLPVISSPCGSNVPSLN